MSNAEDQSTLDVPRARFYKESGKTREGLPWQVLCGDAKTTLSSMQEDTFDCVVTSPPYFWQRDYNVEGQLGLEGTVEEYVTAIADVADEVKRTLKASGTFFLNIGDTYYSGKGQPRGPDPKSSARRLGLRAVDRSGGLGIGLQPKSVVGVPWRVALELIGREWTLRTPIVWQREYALPEPVRDRPRRTYEYVFLFSKARKYYFDRRPLEEREEEDIWRISERPDTQNGLETAPFPGELVRRCLRVGCPSGGSVMDPFMGSGTTLSVALEMQCSATGIDLNPDFCAYVASTLQGR